MQTSKNENGLFDLDTTNVSLSDFLKKVLEHRFPTNRYKQEVDTSNIAAGKIRFACPFCGDSDKKDRKKRGNIYLKSKTYKCFNDKCNKYLSLKNFFGIYSQMYAIIPPSIIMDDSKVNREYSKQKSNLFLDFIEDEDLSEKLIKIDDLIFRFGLKEIDFSADTAVSNYLKNRKVDSYKEVDQFVYADSQDNKVYLVNVHLKTGVVLGLATRYLQTDSNIKYKIVDYTPLNKLFRTYLKEDQLLTVNFMNNYFNLLNLDLDDVVTFVEGQFDSMFINNCAAVSGVSKTKAIFDNFEKDKMRIAFDNDKAGRAEMMRLIEAGYSVILWSNIITDLKRTYPSRLKEIRRVKDINDLYKFLSNAEQKYNISKFNKYLDKYFSNSPYDLFFL